MNNHNKLTILKINKYSKIILLSLFSLYLLYHFYHNLFKEIFPLKEVLVIISIFSIPLTFFYYKNILSKYDFIFIAYIVLIILWSTITQNIIIFHYHAAYFSTIFICAAIMIANKDFPSYLSRILFIIIALTFIYLLYIKNINLINQSYLYSMNRSRISMYCIIFSSLIYITDYQENKIRTVLWPSIISLIISVKSFARLGTIISFILFVLILLLNLNYYLVYVNSFINKHKELKIIAVIIVIFIIFYSALLIYKNSRLSTTSLLNSSNQQRIDIFQSFFDQLTLFKFLTGFKPEYIPHNMNHFHNSYLVLLSHVGVAAFPLFIFIIWQLIYYFKHSKLLFTILLSFCIFSIPDWQLFFKYPDIIFYSLSLIFIKDYLKSKNNISLM